MTIPVRRWNEVPICQVRGNDANRLIEGLSE